MAEMDPNQMQGGAGGEGGGTPSAGEIIANVDTLLSVLSEAIMTGPAPDEIKQRMAALQEEFRSIITAVSQQSQQGGGGAAAGGGQRSGGMNPQPVRGQGTPSGMY
jgi:hypothetical protein